jgi:hypothetical protein
MNPGVTLHAMLLDFIISPTENQNKQKEQHRYNFNYLIKLSYIRPFGIYNNLMSYSSHLDYTRHMLHENYNKLIKANIRDGQYMLLIMILHLPTVLDYAVKHFLVLLHELRFGISANLQMKTTCALLMTFYFFLQIYTTISCMWKIERKCESVTYATKISLQFEHTDYFRKYQAH